MNVKLTLKMDEDTIERAKSYAQKTNQSLSSLVQNFFNLISEKYEIKESELPPIVQELSGIIELDDNFNYKEEYHKHIMEKYS
jgi:hypothetical protein